MIKLSIRYVAEMANGEYLFTMYDDTGYSAITVTDFADANLYTNPDDRYMQDDLESLVNGKIRMEIGCKDFKQVVKVEMKMR